MKYRYVGFPTTKYSTSPSNGFQWNCTKWIAPPAPADRAPCLRSINARIIVYFVTRLVYSCKYSFMWLPMYSFQTKAASSFV